MQFGLIADLREFRKLSLKKHPEYAKNNEIRMKAFADSKNGLLRISDEYIGYAALREGGKKKYSAVITGSDQLWSPADCQRIITI